MTKRLTELEVIAVIEALERSLDGNGWLGEHAAAAARALTKLSERQKSKAAPIDPRHRIFIDLIIKAYQHFLKDIYGKPMTPLIGDKAGNNLKRLLASYKTLDEKQFKRWLTNYHKSDNHNPYDLPTSYILTLPKYEGGPLNKFGRPDATD